ncbi:hypothetical protein SAMN05444266_107358 [Chitinophaga jiangningensis]|uniref:Uncharacterized protein n=1 Tax=Chitinophaga jiangningensis TaxID=1419482 RepID=A0A1M7HTM5_9BACT|nr:hypothetical protein SAMN05444266_107358 [Chitinophaga jiangningensis]
MACLGSSCPTQFLSCTVKFVEKILQFLKEVSQHTGYYGWINI